MPPGPPVLKTVVAEIYGPPAAEYGQLIAYGSRPRRIFDHTSGLVDTDDFAVARQPRLQFVLDREKAALHGVNSADVAQTLALMLGGGAVDTVHTDTERDPLLIELRTNRPVAGFPDPTFFTATAMIGMIALAGIAVRNSIILIDFIHRACGRTRPRRGHPRSRRDPPASDRPYRGCRDARFGRDHARPDLLGSRLVVHLRHLRFDRFHTDRRAAHLLYGLSRQQRRPHRFIRGKLKASVKRPA